MARRDFLIIAPYKYSYLLTYLLTKEFLVDNIYDTSINNAYKLTFLLERLECYTDTQMKAYDITKLTDELNSDSAQYRNKIYYLAACFVS